MLTCCAGGAIPRAPSLTPPTYTHTHAHAHSGYGLQSLECLGGFDNLRREFAWAPPGGGKFTLELDATSYPWGTLYELECETVRLKFSRVYKYAHCKCSIQDMPRGAAACPHQSSGGRAHLSPRAVLTHPGCVHNTQSEPEALRADLEALLASHSASMPHANMLIHTTRNTQHTQKIQSEPEALRADLEALLASHGVAYSYSKTSKFANFINRTLL